MGDLRASVYSLAIISVSVGILDIFSGFGGLKKYTKYIISLILVCSLLLPVKNIFSVLKQGLFEDFSDSFSDSELVDENSYITPVEIGLSKKISDYFSLPPSAFLVEIQIDNTKNEKIITDIIITLTDRKYFYLCEKIEAYLKSSFGCEVSVIQNFEGE